MPRTSTTLPAYAVIRQPRNACDDEAAILDILDRGLVAHVAFISDGRPMVIPMAYGRAGSTLYLHGARNTRIVSANSENAPLCLSVTHIDGIVAARSAFHHSMNYRSAVIHGNASVILDREEHERALQVILEHSLPGRWSEVRPMLDKERKATGVLAMSISAASAKIRGHGPVDEADDYGAPTWAGVIPVISALGRPLDDGRVPQGVKPPPSVLAALRKFA